MEALTPWHLVLILLAAVLLFGYKKLPEASRSLGRSVRIFKGELHALAEEAGATSAPADPAAGASSAVAKAEAGSSAPAAVPELVRPSSAVPVPGVPSPEALDAEAVAEEARAARLRERAAQLDTRGLGG